LILFAHYYKDQFPAHLYHVRVSKIPILIRYEIDGLAKNNLRIFIKLIEMILKIEEVGLWNLCLSLKIAAYYIIYSFLFSFKKRKI